jgi:hypothetical protein
MRHNRGAVSRHENRCGNEADALLNAKELLIDGRDPIDLQNIQPSQKKCQFEGVLKLIQVDVRCFDDGPQNPNEM